MTDREKVIDNLEYHIHLLYDVIPHVSRDDGEYLEAAAKTMSDAIILLKAQEPRVMTESELDEYISSFDGEAAIWIEHKTLGLHCATLWSNNPSRSGKDFYDIRYECYYERSAIGSHWRPWTRRPSDAQRGATPWG